MLTDLAWNISVDLLSFWIELNKSQINLLNKWFVDLFYKIHDLITTDLLRFFVILFVSTWNAFTDSYIDHCYSLKSIHNHYFKPGNVILDLYICVHIGAASAVAFGILWNY